MSVEELVKRLRHSDEYEPLGHDGWEAADKLEELAAENERLRRERVEANNEWRKAYNELTVKTEVALAEAKRKNETLTYQNEVQRALIKELRNAGGNNGE